MLFGVEWILCWFSMVFCFSVGYLDLVFGLDLLQFCLAVNTNHFYLNDVEA